MRLTGTIHEAPDGAWLHPDNPRMDPEPILDKSGRPLFLSAPPPQYTGDNTPEICEQFTQERTAEDEQAIGALLQSSSVRPSPLTRLLAILHLHNALANIPWELIGHHARVEQACERAHSEEWYTQGNSPEACEQVLQSTRADEEEPLARLLAHMSLRPSRLTRLLGLIYLRGYTRDFQWELIGHHGRVDQRSTSR